MRRSEHPLQTFGDHLLLFANSVDIVTSDVYRQILQSIERHFRTALGSSFFAVVTESTVEGEAWLYGEWPDRKKWWKGAMRNEAGQFTCQVALAFKKNKPLWIVGVGAGGETVPLHTTDEYRDLLGNSESSEIPKFAQIDRIVSRTSMIFPLRSQGRQLGVMNVESEDDLPMEEAWVAELMKIADAISLLHLLADANKVQMDSTQIARQLLEDSSFVPVIGRRVVFFAYPKQAEPDVRDVVIRVLEEFSSECKLLQWEDLGPGPVRENIWEKISTCTIGACYFSEKSPGDTHAYRDNSNVLFEAGMMFALRHAGRTPLRGLLLVREGQSPEIPFDLSDENLVIVKRDANGLRTGDLEEKVRAFMRELLRS